MARKRNYKAERERRISRLMEEGFSRAQAGGHPKKGEKSVTETRKALEDTGISNKELVEKYGGVYSGVDAIGYYNAKFFDSSSNMTALNNAVAFAKALPRATTIHIKMHGFQIRAKHSKPGKRDTNVPGEFTWSMLSDNVTPGYIKRVEGKMRKDASYYYDMVNSDAEFHVAWKTKK